jgi:hypothetical protein
MDAKVWTNAAIQNFNSIGIAFGGLIGRYSTTRCANSLSLPHSKNLHGRAAASMHELPPAFQQISRRVNKPYLLISIKYLEKLILLALNLIFLIFFTVLCEEAPL